MAELPNEDPSVATGDGVPVWVAVAVTAILSVWLLVKAQLFRGLEYSWDLFYMLQLSRSWLMGRPFLWENRWGRDAVSQVTHNFFFSPLLGLLTLPLSVYGLFLAHAGFLWLAFVELFRVLRPWPRGRRFVCAFAVLLGPISFWIWDDPFYGWHVELLYLPAAVLFACALDRGSRSWMIWATMLVLLREDGAVVACSVHLLHSWLRAPEPLWSRASLQRTARIGVAWLVVFAVGLAIQAGMHPLANRRLMTSLSSATGVAGDLEVRTALARDIGVAFVFLGSGLLIAAPRCRGPALLASLPVLAVAIVAALAYDARGIVGHGSSWAPRFVMLWGVVGAAVAASPRVDPTWPQVPRRRSLTLAIMVSLLIQVMSLAYFKGYDLPERLAQALPESSRVVAAKLGKREKSFLACLSAAVPTDTPLAAQAALFGSFHRHDLVWARYPRNAWRRPRVVVCESRGQLPKDRACPVLQEEVVRGGFLVRTERGISVAYDPLLASCVETCGTRP